MAVDERSVAVVSTSTPPVADWNEGADETWADDDDLALLAAALDRDGDLYAASLTTTTLTGSERDDLYRGVYGWEAPGPAAFGIGWSGVGESQRTTAVFVYDDAGRAEEPVEPLGAMFTGTDDARGAPAFDVDSIDVDGRAVILTGSSEWDVP
jgi:hypothetical protein